MIQGKLIILAFLVQSICHAQTSNSQLWKELLSNNRKEAQSILRKEKDKKSLEHKIKEAIINTENGQINTDPKFLPTITSETDFDYENYIYALWTEPYVFGTYIESSFDKEKLANVKHLQKLKHKDGTVTSALNYISGISKRYQNDWDAYSDDMSKIDAIIDWQLCGPFENLNNSGIDLTYPPETSAKSDKEYNANSNGHLYWYTPNPSPEPYIFYMNHGEYGYGVNYAQTFFESANSQRVHVKFGSSSKSKIWLNDVLIFEGNKDVDTDLDAFTVEVTIPKGSNRLLVKSAEGNGVSYFAVRLTDLNGEPLTDYKFQPHPIDYQKSTLSEINPQPITHSVEAFFLNKRNSAEPDFFIDYCLIKTYLRNGKFNEAQRLIEPWYKEFPNSSMLKKLLILSHIHEADYTSINELKKNFDLNDPDYYFNLVYKSTETEKIQKMTLEELQVFRKRFEDNLDSKFLLYALDFNIIAREMNESGLKDNLNKIIKLTEDRQWMYGLSVFANFHSTVFSDDEKSKEILKRNVEDWFHYSIYQQLYNLYNKQGKKDKALDIYLGLSSKMPEDNQVLQNIINHLYKNAQYNKALKYVNQALKNYPYSFVIMEKKADILVQLNNKDEALTLYKKALTHNSADQGLRTKIDNILSTENKLEALKTPDIYEYVKTNRSTEVVNNYGYTILLDEVLNEILDEGGSKREVTTIYKITSQNGIDIFKEYNLGLNGRYLFKKTEIIKKNGSISPADKNGSSLVFKGLEIGDVIYLNYEQTFSGTGRFYKAFIDYNSFDSYHPSLKTIYKVLVPNNVKINYEEVNGKIGLKQTEEKDYTIYDWTLENVKNREMYEDYMPIETDIFRYLHISTIKNWNEIAVWYSDLVRSQIEENPKVDATFDEIFPNGIEGLSDEKKAKKIYYYIVQNINYSSVNFRQSGFIPQKPSKTLKTKLGDCKDLSTLFVILAQKANVKANLVLVLTSQNGTKALRLPSQNFNHCIVKTNLDGKDQYLELTDKNLPFKALPNNLINSLILNIPLKADASVESELQNLVNPSKVANLFKNNVEINIQNNHQEMTIKTISEGSFNSYYASVFTEPNYEVKKKKITEDIKGRMGSNLTVDSLFDIKYIVDEPQILFSTKISIEDKINKIGSTYIYKIPLVSQVLTSYIINKDERKYPINYKQYENVDKYETTYKLRINESQKFTDIPDNLDISFLNHRYKLTYTKVNDHELLINKEATTNLPEVSIEKYPEFKAYVKQILEAEESFIGFK